MLQKYYPHYRSLLKLAVPLILTQAGQMTVQLVDNAMVGHVGTAELAAAFIS
jgi:MATE family multidrug resistance protein